MEMERLSITPAARPAMQFRQASMPSDWKQVREICLQNANPEQDLNKVGNKERRLFFSELWIGPYQKLLPEWTWVAARPLSFHSGDNEVLGYLTGTPDTQKFLKMRRKNFDLPLFWQIARRHYGWSQDTLRFSKSAILTENRPEGRFGSVFLNELYQRFPAHLHLNVSPLHRHEGIGHRLLDEYFTELRSVGVFGVHVFCGSGPLTFYQQTGFEVAQAIDIGPEKSRVFALTRNL